MYIQAENPKEKKNKAVTDSVAKSKSDKSTFKFIDSRPETITQRKLREAGNNSQRASLQRGFHKIVNETPASIQMLRSNSNDITGGNANGGGTGVLQLRTVTVRNTTDDYSSGWVQAETQSTGVEPGPQAEAQRVAEIIGGSWVGGHMVNDRLGGGGGFGNIVPITSTMNNEHHTIENAAQQIVGANGSDYEVKYRMNILARNDYTIGNDEVKNLADQFQQHYDYRTKEVQAGGTQSRPIPYQAAGDITSVDGSVLTMDV